MYCYIVFNVVTGEWCSIPFNEVMEAEDWIKSNKEKAEYMDYAIHYVSMQMENSFYPTKSMVEVIEWEE